MRVIRTLFLLLCGSSAASAADIQQYVGICEPSAGAFINATQFVVGSDESNVLRIYERGRREAVDRVDLQGFTRHKKSDLEAAAAHGKIIYWSASQSDNRHGEDEKRKVVFKTEIAEQDGKPILRPVGVIRNDLKAGLVARSGSTPGTINVEGLAATPEGGLLFGLRNLTDGTASVVELKNADAVLSDTTVQPVFGERLSLDLGGRGIRSLERVGARYLIVAGKPKDTSSVGYALYWWDGPGKGQPVAWASQPAFVDFDPEAAMPLPDGKTLQIISDNGDRCANDRDDEPLDPARTFSSMDVAM